MRILTGSLKYSPIYKSHCLAFGKQCEKEGHDVIYLFSSKYKRLIDEKYYNRCIFLGQSDTLFLTFKDSIDISLRGQLKELFQKIQPDIVYLHNYHLLNNYIGRIV